jgi:methionyl-tRNA formyltransferase
LRALDVELGVMAYVLQFAAQSFVNIPRHGTIQYHPSLLPAHRGPSSINWPIIRGKTATGVSIFRPTDGLDEGPVILQKPVRIGLDDTVGSVYFGRLFPAGVDAMLEAADAAPPRRWRSNSNSKIVGAHFYGGSRLAVCLALGTRSVGRLS